MNYGNARQDYSAGGRDTEKSQRKPFRGVLVWQINFPLIIGKHLS